MHTALELAQGLNESGGLVLNSIKMLERKGTCIEDRGLIQFAAACFQFPFGLLETVRTMGNHVFFFFFF